MLTQHCSPKKQKLYLSLQNSLARNRLYMHKNNTNYKNH